VSTVLAAVIPEPNASVELREIPEPELEPNSALLEVELSEVCGTDVHLQRGNLSAVPYPFIPGHVSIGRLGKINGQMLDLDGKPFEEGDRGDISRCPQDLQCVLALSGGKGNDAMSAS